MVKQIVLLRLFHFVFAVCCVSFVLWITGTSVLILEGLRLCTTAGDGLRIAVLFVRLVGFIW
jgi:hypothetical protein